MSKVEDVSNTTTEANEYSTPGTLLKKGRGKAGYSLEELAKELYLAVPKLQALEEDRYEDLPSTVFAQGYIRKYAKAVGLSEKEMVDSFNDYLAQMRQTIDPITKVEEAPITKGVPPKWVMPAGVFGIAIVVLAVVVVFITGDSESEPEIASTAVFDRTDTNSNFNSEDLNSNGHDATPLVADAEAESAANVNNEPVSNTEVNDGLTIAGNTRVNQNTDTESGIDAKQVEESTSASPLAAIQAAANPGSSAQLSALENDLAIQSALEADLSRLSQASFSFTEDCWLQVTDANGKIIYAQVVAGGQSIELSGERPLQVTLGKARAATVVFNGAPVDVPVRAGQQTAKMELN